MKASCCKLLRVTCVQKRETHQHFCSVTAQVAKLYQTFLLLLLYHHHCRECAIQSYDREVTGQLPMQKQSNLCRKQTRLHEAKHWNRDDDARRFLPLHKPLLCRHHTHCHRVGTRYCSQNRLNRSAAHTAAPHTLQQRPQEVATRLALRQHDSKSNMKHETYSLNPTHKTHLNAGVRVAYHAATVALCVLQERGEARDGAHSLHAWLWGRYHLDLRGVTTTSRGLTMMNMTCIMRS